MTQESMLPTVYGDIHTGIVELLETARRTAARSVNALMTASYWEIGRRIVEFEQGGKERAAYGEALIRRLGEDLTRRFGRGFGWRNLTQMRSFYLAWPGLPDTSCRHRLQNLQRSQFCKHHLQNLVGCQQLGSRLANPSILPHWRRNFRSPGRLMSDYYQ